MRYFDRNRRRLTKKRFVRGTLTKSNGENEVTIENSAGLPLNGICISGNTQQYVDADNPLSPDHPQAIENVNIDDTNIFTTEGAVTGGLTDSGTTNTNGNYKTTDFLEVVPNQTYLLQYKVNYVFGERKVYAYNSDQSFISMLYLETPKSTGVKNWLFTTPKNCKFIRFQWRGGANSSSQLDTDMRITKFCGVIAHGKNLATAQQVCNSLSSYKTVEYDGRQCVSYLQNNGNYFVLEGGFKSATQYTISFDTTSVGTGNGAALYFLYDGITPTNEDVIATSWGTTWKRIVKTSRAGKTLKGIGTITADYRRTVYIDINTFMLQEGAISDPVYEPYFREEIAIPTEIISTTEKPIISNGITLENGAAVSLLMSEWDKLTVDRLNNKVIYTDGTYRKTFTGDEPFYISSVYDRIVGRYFFTDVYDLVIDSGYCTHFKRVDWLTNKTATNVFCVANATTGKIQFAFKTDGDTSVSPVSFRQYLKSLYDNGTPVIVQAQRTIPIEHDITDTDFGQALLNLVVPRTQSGVLRVESALPASGLEVEYYSMEKEDKVTLEVLCVSEVGEELKRTSHSVRKYSKYQVKAPEIDGYTPINESIFGVASEEAEIIFEYKEEEDATV